MRKYNEIFRLKEMLDKLDIPYEFRGLFEGYQILYPNKTNCVCSVIEHNFSYGRDKDLLEIQGLLTEKEEIDDDVLGNLTAEDVFGRICLNYYRKLREGEND